MNDSERLFDNKLHEFIGNSSRKISYKTQKLYKKYFYKGIFIIKEAHKVSQTAF